MVFPFVSGEQPEGRPVQSVCLVVGFNLQVDHQSSAR